MSWDTIVIGAGHNGLTAAAHLARAGQSVLVLDRQAEAGGQSAPVEFAPGGRVPGVRLDTTDVRPSALEGLGLEAHGLRWAEDETPVLSGHPGGRGLMVWRDPERASGELVAASSRDAESYAHWRAFLARVRPRLDELLDEIPPPADPELTDLLGLARSGLGLRKLGKDDLLELLRVPAMSVSDWLSERFDGDALKATLASRGLAGTWAGPRSAGTAAPLLLAEVARGHGVAGGAQALTRALVSGAEAAGAELLLGTGVASLLVRDGRAVGVRSEKGEEYAARWVLSTADPIHTFHDLVPRGALPWKADELARHWRQRGTTAVLWLALEGEFELRGREGHDVRRFHTAENLEHQEQAFDPVKYGDLPERPWLDVAVASRVDPSLAPEGGSVLCAHAHSVPTEPRGGWTPAARDELHQTLLTALAPYITDMRERVVGSTLLTPADLEERYGVRGGHLDHGELSLSQLWLLRPGLCASRLHTPLEGLVLAGRGTHPGGTLSCAPGALAARTVLA